MAILDWLEGGGWLNFSPLFPLNLGYPLRFNQGFYNFQDSQKTLSLGNTWRGGGGMQIWETSIQTKYTGYLIIFAKFI